MVRQPTVCLGLGMRKHNTRVGMILFAIYLLLYGGFVFLSGWSPESLESKPVAGVNLAILYGFGLIIAAFALALLYGLLARRSDEAPQQGSPQQDPKGGAS